MYTNIKCDSYANSKHIPHLSTKGITITGLRTELPKKCQKQDNKHPETKFSIYVKNLQLATTDLTNSIGLAGYRVNPCPHPVLASCN